MHQTTDTTRFAGPALPWNNCGSDSSLYALLTKRSPNELSEPKSTNARLSICHPGKALRNIPAAVAWTYIIAPGRHGSTATPTRTLLLGAVKMRAANSRRARES